MTTETTTKPGVLAAPDYMNLRAASRTFPVSDVADALAMVKRLGLNSVGAQDRPVATMTFRDGEVAGQIIANRHGDLRWISISDRKGAQA